MPNQKGYFTSFIGISMWQKPGQAPPQCILDTRCLEKSRAIIKKNLLASDSKKSLQK